LVGKTRKEIYQLLGPPTDDMGIRLKGEVWLWRCGIRTYHLRPNFGNAQVFDAYEKALKERGISVSDETPIFQDLKVRDILVHRDSIERSLGRILDTSLGVFLTPTTPVRSERQ
jgi:hypothetical protein